MDYLRTGINCCASANSLLKSGFHNKGAQYHAVETRSERGGLCGVMSSPQLAAGHSAKENKATGPKMSKRCVLNIFGTGCFAARQGLFVIPCKCADHATNRVRLDSCLIYQ